MLDEKLRPTIETLGVTFIIIFFMFAAFIVGYCEISGGWF